MCISGQDVAAKSDAIKNYTLEQLVEFLKDVERDSWIKNNMISYVIDNKLINKSIAKPLVEKLSGELIDQYKGNSRKAQTFYCNQNYLMI